jgi:hypothetical protein
MTRSPRLRRPLVPRALHAGLLVVALALLPAVASAQLSSTTSSNASSTCSQGNDGNGFCGSSTQELIDNGTTFQSRYAWNINADVGIGSTRDSNGNAQHNMSFNATAPGGYRLDIATSFVGDMNRINDASGCNGASNVSGVTGSSNFALSSGSLSVGDPGSIGNGGSTTSTGFGPTSSAQLFRVSNGSAQGHSLTFTWNGQTRSNSCEAAVRLGQQNGSTSGCNACGYGGSPGRTQSSDGHFVTVTYTSLCGNSTVDASVGEQCDQGAANGTAGSCCASTCQFKTNGTACTDDGNVCTNDQCNGASVTCQHPNNTAPCSDGTFCNGADTCSGGSCTVHAGNPCPGPDGDGNCSESCNEAADNCALADPNGSACSDGTFCNGTDTCSGGACSGHTGNPCPGPDGDGNCSESCNEGSDNCTLADPNGSTCTDGLFCNGTDTCGSGTCSTHTGDPCAGPDGDANCSESCNEGGDNCTAPDPNGSACTDDGNVCTTDACSGGLCDHPAGNAGTECRGTAGVCDVAESCDGVNTACPADGFAAPPSNLALGGTASQSSTDGGTADLANDGDTDGDFNNGSVTQTLAETEAYWDVDLGSSSSIENIEIWNRTDAATAALSEFYVFVSEDPFTGTTIADSLAQSGVLASFQTAEADGPSVVSVGNTGRYVRVQLSGGDALTLAEVRVLTGGTSCRSAAGDCDAEDFCDGSGTSCPADAKIETECRSTAGVCDVAESCDGVTDDCPVDAFEPATTECRASNGVCDVADNCDGLGAACPTDVKVANGTECRATGGICDVAEACDGATDDCPADLKVVAGTECRATAGVCDPAEACDGSNDACPADALEPAGTLCRGAAGVCDVADNCDGVNAACTADIKVAGGTECRGTAGVCDPAEACDGSTDDCPADALEPAGTLCRGAAGVCDVADNCDGVSAACTADIKVAGGTECRATAGVCDPAEACDGSTDDCPADARTPAGTECRASADDCDVADNCDGSSVACPADVVASAGTECRAEAGGCDVADSCDGSSTACPADVVEPAGSECRASAGVCDPAETCDGSSNACPSDALEPSTTVCRPSIDAQCDIDETCDGSLASCPPDVTEPDGLICDDGNSGSVGETCLGGTCGCFGPDLDADTISDNCDPEDAQFTLSKITVWASGAKPGRLVAKGTVPTLVYGPADQIDVSSGLTVAVVDNDQMNVIAPFTAAQCSVKASGLIKCNVKINSTQKRRIILKPIRLGGVPTGDYKLKLLLQGHPIASPMVGPITASISHGQIDRVGSNPNCTGGILRIQCKD